MIMESTDSSKGLQVSEEAANEIIILCGDEYENMATPPWENWMLCEYALTRSRVWKQYKYTCHMKCRLETNRFLSLPLQHYSKLQGLHFL